MAQELVARVVLLLLSLATWAAFGWLVSDFPRVQGPLGLAGAGEILIAALFAVFAVAPWSASP